MWVLYVLFGGISGVFCGLGMGGGTLLTPLIGFLGVGQKFCQAINLVSFIVTASVSLVFHVKNGLVEKKHLFEIVFPACITSLMGALVATLIPAWILKKVFGGILIIVGLGDLIKSVMQAKSQKSLKISKKIK